MKFKGWLSSALLLALMLSLSTMAYAIPISLDYRGIATGGGPGVIGPYKLNITGDVAINAGGLSLVALKGDIIGVCADVAGGVSDPSPSGSWIVQKHALFSDPNTNNIGSLEKGAGAAIAADSTHAKFFETTPDNFRDATLYDYKVGAYLANGVLSNLGAANAAARADYQHALWGWFKTDYVLTAAQSALITTAQNTVASGRWMGWQNFAVYTKVPLGTAPPGGTQEFFVKVPEAGSFASLGLYFGGLGLLGYAFRRRMK